MRRIDEQAGRHGMVATISKCAENIGRVKAMISITFCMCTAKSTIQKEDSSSPICLPGSAETRILLFFELNIY